MSMSTAVLAIRNCRISGTFEERHHDNTGSVCQIDLELSVENAARVLHSWPVGPCSGPHNHTEYVTPRDKEAIRQMAARWTGAIEPLKWEPIE